jgi:4-amino-4-deoxy-L-arabinose transferase-like glycosyltransferase
LPLGWVLLTVIFFSLSSGKRGIYIMPALPAAILAAAPYLPELFRRRGVRHLSLALAAVVVIAAHALIAGHVLHSETADQLIRYSGLSSTTPIVAFAAAGGLLWLITWRRSPLLAWPAVLAGLVLVWAYAVVPQINDVRSGRAFMERALARVPEKTQLGFVAYKEQFLLYVDRPVVNFGHGRYAETDSHAEETYDAARWLNSHADRLLLLPEALLSPCFANSPRTAVGETSRQSWFLVGAPAAANCASEGNPQRAIPYNIQPRPVMMPR